MTIEPIRNGATVLEPTYGFRHLDPIPSTAELDSFYSTSYMELIDAGGRAPELRRLLREGPERESELAWIRSTLYADIEAMVRPDGRASGRGHRLIDIGAGTGDFIAFAGERGWDARGVEPSKLASERAKARGLAVFSGTLEEALAAYEGASYHALTMLNVLEHVPDAIGYVRQCRSLLAARGKIAIVVPNDFSAAQSAAARALGIEKKWWVAAPDHINYFTFESLERMLEGEGFDIVERSCNFPMELFLMMGDDYVSRPELGAECHRRRQKLEAAMPTELRRGLYRAFADHDLGRNCIVIGEKRA